ncbi:unnamed protein product [Bursaphelenchus okinawaensis]|uniref:Uncharacterized protein n=1 Tax=Bursaphelenchus okinawaensis TaxID=465554 RepID=A0A811KD88_9BILA|nr:unnamed protein product [Bursaphelenchus okinawaensis]CAG9102466.1 unnamed protein product [Bursaphelenchus okinawaensis]
MGAKMTTETPPSESRLKITASNLGTSAQSPASASSSNSSNLQSFRKDLTNLDADQALLLLTAERANFVDESTVSTASGDFIDKKLNFNRSWFGENFHRFKDEVHTAKEFSAKSPSFQKQWFDSNKEKRPNL